jgi:hypothetical protein
VRCLIDEAALRDRMLNSTSPGRSLRHRPSRLLDLGSGNLRGPAHVRYRNPKRSSHDGKRCIHNAKRASQRVEDIGKRVDGHIRPSPKQLRHIRPRLSQSGRQLGASYFFFAHQPSNELGDFCRQAFPLEVLHPFRRRRNLFGQVHCCLPSEKSSDSLPIQFFLDDIPSSFDLILEGRAFLKT